MVRHSGLTACPSCCLPYRRRTIRGDADGAEHSKRERDKTQREGYKVKIQMIVGGSGELVSSDDPHKSNKYITIS